MAGKGDKRRKCQVPQSEADDNYDAIFSKKPMCKKCNDTKLVCENHPDLPWDGVCDEGNACHCGGAGMPCECC